MNDLTPQQQNKIEQVRINLESLRVYIVEKSKLISTISSLSAMVLIVATFNDDLLVLTRGIKIALSILLLLIPISLLISIFEFHNAISSTKRGIEKIVGKVEIPPREKRYQRFFDFILNYYPFVGGFLLLIIIIYIIISIW